MLYKIYHESLETKLKDIKTKIASTFYLYNKCKNSVIFCKLLGKIDR